MVRKLFKHELYYYLRSLLPAYIVMLGIAVMGRVIGFFEADTATYTILRGSAVFALGVAAFTVLALSTIFCITRYYRNLFTGEGYLTLTLPVTTTQHLLIKIGAAMLAMIASLLIILAALCIFLLGDWLVEIVKAGVYLLNNAIKMLDGNHLIFYIIEFAVLLIVSLMAELLLFYMCISLGQTFRKNRVLAAIGIYFGLYMITQTLSTVFMIITTLFYDYLPLQQLGNWIASNPFAFAHWFFCLSIAACLAMATIYFLISRFVLTKKLNLE